MIQKAIATFGFVLVYFPLSWLVYCAFTTISPVDGTRVFTLELFRALWADQSLTAPLLRSVWVAAWAALLSGVMGTMLAFSAERSSFFGKKVLLFFVMLPVAIPEIVLGIALLGWFAALKFQFGFFTLVIAHVTFSTGYVFATVTARIRGFDQRLEESALDLGATPRQVFWRVTLPLMMPGILSGVLLAFVLSFDDFLISYFVTGAGYDTLPIKLYSMMKFGLNPTVYPFAVILLALTSVAVVAGALPGVRRKPTRF